MGAHVAVAILRLVQIVGATGIVGDIAEAAVSMPYPPDSGRATRYRRARRSVIQQSDTPPESACAGDGLHNKWRERALPADRSSRPAALPSASGSWSIRTGA